MVVFIVLKIIEVHIVWHWIYWSCLKSFEVLVKTVAQSGKKSNWLIVVFLRPKISPSHPIIRHWYLNLSFWMFLSNSFSSLAYIISNQYVNKILILRMLGLEMIERTFINLVTHTNANARIFTRNFNNDHSIVSNTPLILYLPRCFK